MAWEISRRDFKPYAPFTTAMKLLIPTTEKVKGVSAKTFPEPKDGELIYGTFRTYGGTEKVENGVITVIDTATIDTWYRPDITSDCRVYVCDSKQTYEILGTPEDILMRHQYLQFKVRKIGGKP